MVLSSLEKSVPVYPLLRSRWAVSLLHLMWNEFIVIHSKGVMLWSPGLFQSVVFDSHSGCGPGICQGEVQGPWLSQTSPGRKLPGEVT